MRNLAVIGLLLIYTTSQVGSIMIYYYRPVIHAISFYRQQRRIRKEEAGVRDITLSIKNYREYLQEDGEVLLNGILHDIRKVVYKDDVVQLQLLEDKNETKWMKTFACFANDLQKQDGRQQKQGQIWNWLFKIYPFEPETDLALHALTPLVARCGGAKDRIHSFSLTTPGQPPESKN